MIILIPLGGTGERFKINGYDKPKSLIDVNNKPILFHLLDNLTLTAPDVDFVYIPYNKEYADYNFETLVKTKYPNIQFHFFKLLENTRGAVETINLSLKYLIDTEVINKDTDVPLLCVDGDNYYKSDIISKWGRDNTVFIFNDKGQDAKYSYIDILEKGTTPVWGFIAQEVAETLDYAVDTMEKAIPNIYSLCDVLEQGYVLQFSNFDTANLARKEDNTLITRLQLRTWKNLEIEVEIKNVMSSSKIRLTSPINFEECNAVLENDDVLENKILAYGQIVDDFLTIKKEAIFTVSVAALQEVDRRQVSDNKRIIELESEVSELQEDLIVTRGELTSVQDELYMAKAQIEDMRLRFEDIMSRLSTLETA